MKKRISIIAIALSALLLIATVPVLAASGITVTLDGKALSFDVPPQIINDRTMVPLRAVFEAFGATVEWDGATQTVTGTKGDTVVVLTIGSTSPTINGKVVTIDQPGVIVNDRTLAPLRFVGEAFGGKVDWDGATNTVTITSGAGTNANNSNGGVTGAWVLGNPFNTAKDVTQWFEFKGDGTFTAYWYIYQQVDWTFEQNLIEKGWGFHEVYDHNPHTWVFKGNYNLSGNTLNLTYTHQSVVEGEAEIASIQNLTFETVSGETMAGELYPAGQRTDASGKEIDSLGSYTEFDSMRIPDSFTSNRRLFKSSTPNGIELWPQGLPDYLYPTGLNGCAQCDKPSGSNMNDISKAFGGTHFAFYVWAYNTPISSLQSYRDTLISKGYELEEFYSDLTESTTWVLANNEKNISAGGANYRCSVRINGYKSYGRMIIQIHYIFESY